MESSISPIKPTNVQARINREKELLVEQLKKTPIIQIACEKLGIGRATYYRWRNDDQEFSQKADQALKEGSLLVNDMAESQLLAAIRDKNMTAIIFWLKNHHPSYISKVEVTASYKEREANLTPEQEAIVEQALKLASLLPPKEIGGKTDEPKAVTN